MDVVVRLGCGCRAGTWMRLSGGDVDAVVGWRSGRSMGLLSGRDVNVVVGQKCGAVVRQLLMKSAVILLQHTHTRARTQSHL